MVVTIDGGANALKLDIRRQLARRNPVAVINEFQKQHELRVPHTQVCVHTHTHTHTYTYTHTHTLVLA